jgi:hypothetical protein
MIDLILLDNPRLPHCERITLDNTDVHVGILQLLNEKLSSGVFLAIMHPFIMLNIFRT